MTTSLSLSAAVHGVSKSPTRLSDFTFTFHFHALEKEMETHSSVFALRIPGMGEPGRLPPMGSCRVGHDWSDLAAVGMVSKKTKLVLKVYGHWNLISMNISRLIFKLKSCIFRWSELNTFSRKIISLPNLTFECLPHPVLLCLWKPS